MYLHLAGRMVKGQGKKTVKKLQAVLLYLVRLMLFLLFETNSRMLWTVIGTLSCVSQSVTSDSL